MARVWTFGFVLAALALAVFAATRLYGLERFPIYFFTDEAIHANWAAYLLEHGLRDDEGTLLPTFFKVDGLWVVSASVYAQLVPVAAFGRSVLVSRAVPALLAVAGAAALTVAAHRAFAHRTYWLTPLVFAVLPCWFLHSRTGFETALTTAWYAMGMSAYMLYRMRDSRWILAVLPLCALAAYSYTNGQPLLAGTGLLLLLSDARYHLQQFRTRPRLMIGAVLLAVVLILPFVRFRVTHPQALQAKLAQVESFMLQDIPVAEKARKYLSHYAKAFEPEYWFEPDHEGELVRHRMKGMGHLPWVLAPFMLLGLVVCLVKAVRSPPHRVVLIMLAATPIGAALAMRGITRLLFIVVPATLLACVGIEALLRPLRRWSLDVPLGAVAALALAVGAAGMTRAAVHEGPTWYTDYGLGGMQWGAMQVFDALEEELARMPEGAVYFSPTWANNPNAFIGFFLPPHLASRIETHGMIEFLKRRERREIDPRTLFVAPQDEFEQMRQSGKFELDVVRVIDYPDGRPGFYMFHAAYVPHIDQIFQAEWEERTRLVDAKVTVRGEELLVRHSQLDMNLITHAFDGQTESLARGKDANPFVLEVVFPTPRELREVTVTTASMDIGLAVSVRRNDGGDPLMYHQVLRGLPPNPRVDFPLPDGPVLADSLRLEVENLNAGEVANIHLREVDWR